MDSSQPPWYIKSIGQMGPITAGFIVLLAALMWFTYQDLKDHASKVEAVQNSFAPFARRWDAHDNYTVATMEEHKRQTYLLREICGSLARQDRLHKCFDGSDGEK